MSKNLKTVGIFSFIVVLFLAVTTLGFSSQQRGKMHQKGMKGMMGTMNMRGMMMRMNNMSQHAKYTMEHMNSLMMDEEYQKDDVMKSYMEEMQEHMKNMTDSMQKAMESMQKMAERASELQEEKK